MGLMDKNRSQLADREPAEDASARPEHREVAREAVRESLVLLKNENQRCRCENRRRIHVAGKSADDIGNQCGGWTIDWQGKSGQRRPRRHDHPGRHQERGEGRQGHLSRDGKGRRGRRGRRGDRRDALRRDEGRSGRSSVGAGRRGGRVEHEGGGHSGRGRVAVRPAHDPRRRAGQADAFIAAWLPGTEGDGVADVLFGDYKPTGKLSFTWPSREATSMARNEPGYKKLFPLGYGLGY